MKAVECLSSILNFGGSVDSVRRKESLHSGEISLEPGKLYST